MRAPHDQHFLIDRRAVQIIADAVDVAGRRVLEIGPGRGVLTRALLERGACVIAVELDSELVDDLETDFSEDIDRGALQLIHGDAIRCMLPPFDIVVANLPYSASSKITFRLLSIGFEVAVLMYQKEFGQRMMALPGTSDTGRLSIMAQTYAGIERILELSPEAFRPKPRVRSVVLKLTPHPPPYPISDDVFYADVVRELFSHRRKTVRRALHIARDRLGPDRVEKILVSIDADVLSARPEALPLAAFAEIANAGVG
jgi:16S rRNA (adenine1518-N6/adenine1519-N6)-dimethyltransferase